MSSAKTLHSGAQGDPEWTNRFLVGNSQPIREIETEIQLTAGGNLTVLITGESGTGKELVAQAIHQRSNRGKGPFKAINCGSLTESLLESRLFGHTKGAFTGATSNQSGLFEAAQGGTIFLDEIGDMPLSLQGYLLRVLQERTVIPVGAHVERKIDVRVIAATNKDLAREIREDRFREDLFYRLNEYPLRVPTLRERPSDIPLLIHHFLGAVEIEEVALALLCRHHWPGNVRELKATIQRLELRAAGSRLITTTQVLREIQPTLESCSERQEDVIKYTAELRKGDCLDQHCSRQKLEIYETLKQSTGSYANAARWLGLSPKTLMQRILRLRRQIKSP